jgi:hypothetical protein
MSDRRPPSATRRFASNSANPRTASYTAVTATVGTAVLTALPLAAVAAFLLAACSATPSPAVPPAAAATGSGPTLADLTLVDRVVALVDEEAILLSDVERVIALHLVDERPEESPAALRERVLDRLVEQRLRFHAADRFGFVDVSVERIEEEVERIAGSFDSRQEFLDRLRSVGLSEGELRQLVARQLMVLNFVDQRLGARVFVSLDDIRTYYDDELTPRLRQQGETPPPLEEVREEIRALLKERRLNEEIERWTEELRREADVQLFLDQPADRLPPVVDRTDEAAAGASSQL